MGGWGGDYAAWGVLGIFQAQRGQEIPQSSLGIGTEFPSICPGQYHNSRDTLPGVSDREAEQGQAGQLGVGETKNKSLLIPPRDKAGEGAKHRVGLACENSDRAVSCWTWLNSLLQGSS